MKALKIAGLTLALLLLGRLAYVVVALQSTQDRDGYILWWHLGPVIAVLVAIAGGCVWSLKSN